MEELKLKFEKSKSLNGKVYFPLEFEKRFNNSEDGIVKIEKDELISLCYRNDIGISFEDNNTIILWYSEQQQEHHRFFTTYLVYRIM